MGKHHFLQGVEKLNGHSFAIKIYFCIKGRVNKTYFARNVKKHSIKSRNFGWLNFVGLSCLRMYGNFIFIKFPISLVIFK